MTRAKACTGYIREPASWEALKLTNRVPLSPLEFQSSRQLSSGALTGLPFPAPTRRPSDARAPDINQKARIELDRHWPASRDAFAFAESICESSPRRTFASAVPVDERNIASFQLVCNEDHLFIQVRRIIWTILLFAPPLMNQLRSGFPLWNNEWTIQSSLWFNKWACRCFRL